jgi:hypothetical protein
MRFIWGLPQEDSFMKLKELITSASVLVLPNDDLLFRLEADGTSIATGAVLSQQSINDNAWHPVTFLSKTLNPVDVRGHLFVFLPPLSSPTSPPVHMYSPPHPCTISMDYT